MGTKKDIYGSEDIILQDFENIESRLGESRELESLVNSLMNIISVSRMYDSEEHNILIDDCRNKLRVEYIKTKECNLNYRQMKVWHKSVFSCLDLFRRKLDVEHDLSVDETKELLNEIIERKLDERIRRFSDEEGIEDFTSQLSGMKGKEIRESTRTSFSITNTGKVSKDRLQRTEMIYNKNSNTGVNLKEVNA